MKQNQIQIRKLPLTHCDSSKLVDKLNKLGFKAHAAKDGSCVVAVDSEGVEQTFYFSTGTIVLHDKNMRGAGYPKQHAIIGADFKEFVKWLKNGRLTRQIFDHIERRAW